MEGEEEDEMVGAKAEEEEEEEEEVGLGVDASTLLTHTGDLDSTTSKHGTSAVRQTRPPSSTLPTPLRLKCRSKTSPKSSKVCSKSSKLSLICGVCCLNVKFVLLVYQYT